MSKIAVLIPCYNEEKGIREVLADMPRAWFQLNNHELDIIVIDNNSTDRTAKVAAEGGARVVFESQKGKGNALLKGMYALAPDTNYVVMLDGDNTYKSHEIPRMIEPLTSGFCEVVIGSRLNGKITQNSMHFLNRLGNSLFSRLVRSTYAANVLDVLSGFYAWNYDVIVKLREQIKGADFRIEMEMVTKMARMGFSIYSVPITYDERLGCSNLNIFKDGRIIFGEFLANFFWRPQLPPAPQKMRIAFVSDAIYPYNIGGKEKRLHEMATRLATRGSEVKIYCMKWWNEPQSTRYEAGIQYHAISRHIPLYSHGRRSIKQAILFALACFQLLFQSYDVMDVDSMPHFPVLVLWLVNWLKRKPMFVTWHEVWGAEYWQRYLGSKGVLGTWVERAGFRLSPNIISVSPHTTKRIKEEFELSNGRTHTISTIPVGVDAHAIAAIPPSHETTDVIYAGRLLSHKNVDYLIHAIGLLREKTPLIHCTIIGEGPEKQHLIELTEELNLQDNITFSGFYEDSNELFSHFKSARCFVLPSTREGFGISVIEANACGLPTVTIDHPENAAKDLIKWGINGFAVKLDPNEIADAIENVFELPHMVNGCYRVVQNYDWSHVMDNVEGLYLNRHDSFTLATSSGESTRSIIKVV